MIQLSVLDARNIYSLIELFSLNQAILDL